MIVTGEFGRTPRITQVASSGGGMATAPAGARTVIGATDLRGDQVVERRVGPGDFLATIYRHLGIDAERIALPDHFGRTQPIL